MVAQNPPKSQRLPPTMVRSMVETIKLTNLQAGPGSDTTMLSYNFQHQELNNNNKNKTRETNNNCQSKNERKLPPPFSFHYTLEAASWDQRLDFELRATCKRYEESGNSNQRCKSGKPNLFQPDVHKVPKLSQTQARESFHLQKTNQQRTSRVNYHQSLTQTTHPNGQNIIESANNFQESLPNQISTEENNHQPTVRQKSDQRKTAPTNQQRKGSSDQQPNMPSQVRWERSDRRFATKPNPTKIEEGGQSTNYHHLPNQTSWEEERGREERGRERAKPPRRLPTISELPQSRLPRLNFTSLSSQTSQHLLNNLTSQDCQNRWRTGKEEARRGGEERRWRRESDVVEKPSKVETWRQMFLERHSQTHRGHHALGLHAHNQPHPRDASATQQANQTPSGPLAPSAFNAGYDERRGKEKARVRFVDNNRAAAAEEEEARSRTVGFSRGLQDGLRRKIERMVRKPHASQDRNYQECREGCGEISNPDFEERGNCDEGGNLERGAKRRRRAWPTPRRSSSAKVTKFGPAYWMFD